MRTAREHPGPALARLPVEDLETGNAAKADDPRGRR
jgi:hypothetical protein